MGASGVHEKKPIHGETQQPVVKKIGSRPEVRTQKQKPKDNHFPINKREKKKEKKPKNRTKEEGKTSRHIQGEPDQLRLSPRYTTRLIRPEGYH